MPTIKLNDLVKEYMLKVIVNPFERLPMLIVHGDVGTGKSIYIDQLTQAFKTVKFGFRHRWNGELEEAIFVRVDEGKLNQKHQMNILHYVVDKDITIQRMMEEPLVIRNKTHWIIESMTPIYNPHTLCIKPEFL